MAVVSLLGRKTRLLHVFQSQQMAFSCKAMKNFKILFSGRRSLPNAKVGVKSRIPSFGVRLVAVPLIASLTFVSACVDGSDSSKVVTVDGPDPAGHTLPGVQLVSASGKYLAGRYARRSRDFGTAADYLSDALSIDASNYEIRRQTFFALVSGGRMAEAAVLAKEIVATDKGAAVANLSLVVEDAIASRFEAAAKRLDTMPRRRHEHVCITPVIGLGEGRSRRYRRCDKISRCVEEDRFVRCFASYACWSYL